MIKIAVPPGIGDALWSLTKIPAIKRKYPDEEIAVCPTHTTLNRAKDFLEHFDFIDKVEYGYFPIQYQMPYHINHNGYGYKYISSQQDFWDGEYDYLLIANGHLERGNRIETWYPELDTDLDIGLNNWVWQEGELDEAKNIHKNIIGDKPYVVFYLGPKTGCTTAGHNRNSLWTLQDWTTTALLMKEVNPELEFVITGASYDFDNVSDLIFERPEIDWINLCGSTPIGVTYAMIKRSNFFLSYQCGLGIFSVYLDHPTAIWWRPDDDGLFSGEYPLFLHKDMKTSWAPKWSLPPDGDYLPMFYKRETPKDIVDYCIKRKYI